MAVDISKWTASDFAAWWGAIVASFALIWNIVTAVRSGPRIKVTAFPNMKVVPRQAITEDNSYISVTAINCGTAPTTITHFAGYYSSSFWEHIRKKRQQFVINTHPVLGSPVPYLLKPGEEWRGLANQDELKKKGDLAYLYLGIIHNQDKRPHYVRVIIKN